MRRFATAYGASVLFLAFLLAVSSTSRIMAAGGTSAAGSALEMKYLSVSKKIIPLVWKDKREFWTTDIKLPEVVLTNRENGNFTLKGVEIRGVCENGEGVVYRLNGDLLVKESRNINSSINKACREGGIDALRPTLAVSFGRISLPESPLSETAVLQKGESTILLLSKVLFVHHTGVSRLTGLSLALSGSGPAGDTVREFPLPLTFHTLKGKYSFPLKGNLMLGNLPLNLDHHRAAMSQEFGFDIVETCQRGNMNYVYSAKSKPLKSSDYLIFHKEILAAGDGTVAAVGSGFPDAVADQILEKPESLKDQFNRLLPSIGFINTLAGNYVIIDHGNSEFSFYAHISEGTIRVKVGDTVKRGVPIGLVGNTGNSTGPHLHFHLMDSADMLSANGLPVMFEDIPAGVMNSYLTEANSLVDSDSLYLHSPVKDWQPELWK